MALQEEIGLYRPLRHQGQETLLNIIVTASLVFDEAHRLLSRYGLTESQLNVLMMLKFQSDDGRLNQTELGRMVLVKRSGLTGLIDRMETSGLVRRLSAPGDRRINLVEMTGKGRELLEKVQQPYFERIDEITCVLPENNQKNLCGLLATLREQLRGTGRKHKKT
jgi:DNA-binding MarR family transcriptional regulator